MELGQTSAAVTAIGDPLPGTDAAGFAEAKAAFVTVEQLTDGLGPIFNERACGNCHTQGAIGGAGTQIERRFGTTFFFFGAELFDTLANDGNGPFPARGGSLRQLMTVGSFTGLNGQSCTAPLEHEPPEATIHNVGRLTTPLFGLGLVDAMPDSFFDSLASAQPSSIRGIANRVTVLLPNPTDASQSLHGTRVGRFGWKAGVATLTQFAADAYVNEMGITTQHCIKGTSVTDFSTESQPNGVAQPAGCDDLAPPQPAGNGVPAGTDDAVGSCAGGKTEIQDDVGEFTEFMTRLAPPPRGTITSAVTAGQTVFQNAGCAGCHVLTTFKTPATTGNGVPGNFSFQPFSDFLVHDMDGLGDRIGNWGDPVAVTHRMRTAPLWGLRFRTLFLHDGRTNSLTTAITQHAGQGAAAASAFNALSATNKSNLLAFLQSL
ncbi:MAG TPA: di-heme oxidoredictase family protein [Kofleriaceae bacterium]|nr:di-heme oxidoredictase family protein [Kofleriaceae bacterium]